VAVAEQAETPAVPSEGQASNEAQGQVNP
jgi:hypothetical protein